jgi:FkbM family methyltransferase
MIKSFFRKFNKFLFYLKYNFKRQLRIFFKIDQIIYIDNKKIILPPGHLLSLYESLYPKYDRFLPTVIGKIKENEVIIDIGANIGDTLFRLLNINTRPYYYCIEADNFFFEYLQKNKKSLDVNIQNKIILIKKFVGDQLKGNLSETETKQTLTGTKSLIESELGPKSIKLDDIILNYKIKNIKLIKVDVDGYDYSILFSAINELTNNKPDIFFEYLSLDELGKKNYLILIEKLNEIGYSNWTMLDNYGSIIFENKSHIDVINKTNSASINKEVFDIYCKFEK